VSTQEEGVRALFGAPSVDVGGAKQTVDPRVEVIEGLVLPQGEDRAVVNVSAPSLQQQPSDTVLSYTGEKYTQFIPI
jgi:hypothetical protein